MIDETRLDKPDDESFAAKVKIEVLDIDTSRPMPKVILRIKVMDEETEKVIYDFDYHLFKLDTITISGDVSEDGE